MSCPNNRFELSLACPEDSSGIQAVFDDVVFEGNIAVHFSRAPDPLRSLQNDGESVVVPIVKEISTGKIVGVGGCVNRTAYVNGKPSATAYLTGLKTLKSYQGRIPFIRKAYDLIHKNTAQANPLYYTTILKNNTQAIKLLEKPRKGMPAYKYIGDYTVYCMGSNRAAALNNSAYIFEKGNAAGLADFYAEHLPKYNLAPQSERLYGLTQSDFYTMRDNDGSILAACAVWNQQSYKQYIVKGYKGPYNILSLLPTKLFGYPGLPKAGAPANYASIALLIMRDENLEIARQFLRLVLSYEAQYSFLMIGLFENHPARPVLEEMRHIRYESRVYIVDFGSSPILDTRAVMLEVGSL